MMSPTGNSTPRLPAGNQGFTFVEVMVTLVILSSGIVFIYKTFFLCADYLSRLSLRLQAVELLDEKIDTMARLLKEKGGMAFSPGDASVVRTVQNKSVTFQYVVDVAQVPGFEDVWRCDVGISWPETGRQSQLSRSAILSL